MKHKNAQPLSEILKEFLGENTELYEKMMEIRIRRGWGELLGPVIMQYTRNLYIKNHVLYVSLNSSVLRNELTYSRERLIKSLNAYAGSTVIHDIIIR
jgi:predicted nucleic acid-binding Zn ribbon protein